VTIGLYATVKVQMQQLQFDGFLYLTIGEGKGCNFTTCSKLWQFCLIHVVFVLKNHVLFYNVHYDVSEAFIFLNVLTASAASGRYGR